MSFLSVQLLEPKNGLKVLKNALGLFFKSFDFLYQYCLIAILLCLVASFLALRRHSKPKTSKATLEACKIRDSVRIHQGKGKLNSRCTE